ncbi:MAG: hypothetical protein ACI9EW_003818 [Cellvibrionaceae bacterium]|jgi:hypothetical protein
MTYQVLVSQRLGLETDIGKGYLQTARQLGVAKLTSCDVSRLYFVKGGCDQSAVGRLTAELLADPVTETFEVTSLEDVKSFRSEGETAIEVTLLPGVTDYLLGTTGDHLAGSHWQMVTGGAAQEGPQAVEGLLDGYRAVMRLTQNAPRKTV